MNKYAIIAQLGELLPAELFVGSLSPFSCFSVRVREEWHEGRTWRCWLHRSRDGRKPSWSFSRGTCVMDDTVAFGHWYSDDKVAKAMASALLKDFKQWNYAKQSPLHELAEVGRSPR